MEGKMADSSVSASPTKKKLADLLNKFDDFEAVMKEGTRQRREHDEHKIEELKEAMAVLEKSLNSEIQRRVEMNKSLQVWCDEQLVSLEERLHADMVRRMEELQVNIDKLNDRVGELEAEFQVEKERIPKDIEERGRILTQQLTDFQIMFEKERKSRLEREAVIMKRLTDHEHEVAERFDKARTIREQKHMEIAAKLEDHIRSRNKGDERFQIFVEEELAALNNALAKERETREHEDDEVVETLTAYTKKLQSSLHIINSMDT